MNKVSSYTKGLVRSAPLVVNLSAIIGGLITRQPIGIFFGIYAYLADLLVHIYKNIFKNYIYKKTNISKIIGPGERPPGAKYCGIFIDENNLEGKATSYGMPSGHAHFGALSGMFWILYVLNTQPNDAYRLFIIILISIIALSIILSRIYLGCHTPQQVFLGSLVGVLMGYLGMILYRVFLTFNSNEQ